MPLPFEDHLSTQACQTGPRNKPQEKHSSMSDRPEKQAPGKAGKQWQ